LGRRKIKGEEESYEGEISKKLKEHAIKKKPVDRCAKFPIPGSQEDLGEIQEGGFRNGKRLKGEGGEGMQGSLQTPRWPSYLGKEL